MDMTVRELHNAVFENMSAAPTQPASHFPIQQVTFDHMRVSAGRSATDGITSASAPVPKGKVWQLLGLGSEGHGVKSWAVDCAVNIGCLTWLCRHDLNLRFGWQRSPGVQVDEMQSDWWKPLGYHCLRHLGECLDQTRCRLGSLITDFSCTCILHRILFSLVECW